MKPTEAQIKEFWEGWGFKFIPHLSSEGYKYKTTEIMEYPNGFSHIVRKGESLELDLNNLFKYAVPFLLEKHTIIETYSFKQENGLYYSETEIWDGDERQLKGKLVSKAFIQDLDLEKANALALFWAIYEVIKNST